VEGENVPMAERVEFHPLAGRVVQWLLAVLTPWVRGAGASAGDGFLAQRADLVVRQHGAQVMIAVAQRLVNRTPSALQICWTVPQPPVASAHAVGVRFGAHAVRGQVYRVDEAESAARRAWQRGRSAVALWQVGPVASCLTAGWVAPNAVIEVTSHHRYSLEARDGAERASLQVRLDASLPSPRPEPAAAAPIGTRGAPLRPAIRDPAGVPPALLAGVLARLSRQVAGGLVLVNAAADRAAIRGSMAGCAVRLLLAQPAADAGSEEAPAPCAAVDRLLRAYRDPFRSQRAREVLARAVTALGLQYQLVTPWTALLADGHGAAASAATPVPPQSLDAPS
jgi:hypothetical protein